MEQDIRKMLEGNRGRYMLVNSMSLRVRALQGGYKPLVPRGANDLIAVAFEEFRQDKLRVDSIESAPQTPDEKTETKK